MKLDFAQRHHVASEENLELLKEFIPKFDKIKLLFQKKGFEHTLILSTDLNKLLTSQQEQLQELVNQIRDKGITVQYEHQLPPGSKVTQQLFFKVSKDIKGIGDLDQFPIEEEFQLQAVIDLANKLITENKLFVSGSRNVPVILGQNKEANDLRIIHEAYNALAGKYNSPTEIPEWANPNRIYKEVGESTSGFYLVNPNHIKFNEVLKIINQNQEMPLKGFTIEYFIAILAGKLNAITSGYIYANTNPFPKIPSTTEINSAKKRIQNVTTLFKNTIITKDLKSALLDKSNQEKLENYFDKELVKEVKELMLKSLS